MVKKTRIRMGIVMVIMCIMCFSDWSFADDGVNTNIGSVAWTLDFVVSVLSRVWVIFAKLAGEFLTNNWIFGEKLGMDILLWQYWTIVRNIANFCLGFYFVYVIFKGLIGQIGDKEDIIKNLKSVLLWILVAGVGIQASWFLTSLFVDLGTITLAAVGSFPSQIISENVVVNEGIKKSMLSFFGDGGNEIAVGKVYTLFPKDASANSFTKTVGLSLDGTLTEENFVDSLLPNKDDVSGPLYYLGFQILKVNQINSFGSWEKNSLKKTILNLIIQGGTTIVYSIEMGVLCVIALMRVLYLWMFIVLSPFAILLACIQKAGEKDLLKKGFIADLMKQINLKTFVAKVFQPAIIVLGFSLSMIFVTLISRVVNSDSMGSMDNFNVGGVSISSRRDNPSSVNSEDVTYTTRFEGDLIEFSVSHLGKSILDLMMSIITVILVYGIINMSIKIGNKIGDGEDFLSKKIDEIQKGVNSTITSVPLVPVSGYDKEGVPTKHRMSLGEVFGLGDKKYRGGLLTQGINRAQGKIIDEYNEQNEVIDKLLGTSTGYLRSEDKRKIDYAMRMGENGFNRLTQARDVIESFKEEGRVGGMILNPSIGEKYWYGKFTDWLDTVDEKLVTDKKRKDMIADWRKESDEKKRDIGKLFGNPDYVQAYASLFKLNLRTNTWEDLRDADISIK